MRRYEVVAALMIGATLVAVVAMLQASRADVRADDGQLKQLGAELAADCRPAFEPLLRCKGSLAEYKEVTCSEWECVQKLACGEFGWMRLATDLPLDKCSPPQRQGAK